jgi:hypothetical protein
VRLTENTFVVIVQPHLLKDKGSVRLQRISFDTPSGSTGGNEIFCSLEKLASAVASGADEEAEPLERSAPSEGESNQKSYSIVEFIYVDTGTSTTVLTSKSPRLIDLTGKLFAGASRESRKEAKPA